MKKSAIIFSFFTALAIVAVGCNKQDLPPGFPELNPTTLTFVCDGSPLADADIMLVPTGAPSQWVVGGKTDADGKLVVRTHGEYLGAPEGEMAVTVRKERREDGEFAKNNPRPEGGDVGAKMAWDRKATAERSVFLVCGSEYLDPSTTPLKITIKKGKNSEKFDLPKVDEQIQ